MSVAIKSEEKRINTEISFPEKNNRDIKEKILDTHTEEIIIGLCGPIGTDIHFIAEEIGNVMRDVFNYEVIIIQLSQFIKDVLKIDRSLYASEYHYINALIDGGNKLRQANGNDILAELAIGKIIAVKREIGKGSEEEFKSNRICYIIDSIKNIDELNAFRMIYSDLFYFIGVSSNVETRERNLVKKGMEKADVYKLIDRDSGEEKKSGQQVSDTFMQADFFLRNDSLTSASLKNKIERFLDLIFDSNIVTPSPDETAMYQAFAAANNSACLSRQVGAAITNNKGEIISVGWNDVPKYLGGVYMFNEEDPLGKNDHRCLNREGGKCFNDEEKQIIRDLLIDKLVKENVIKEEDKQKAENIVKNSRVKELIEFSRAVHAEMHALIIGSQKAGNEIIGGKLYCTTYPCHNCARHIVTAGIKEVYYIEPYRKSLAIKLHNDSISENETEHNKVLILMFDGVSPRRYLELFRMLPNSRKQNGKKLPKNKRSAFPKNTVSLQAIPILEKKVIQDLQSKKLIEI